MNQVKKLSLALLIVTLLLGGVAQTPDTGLGATLDPSVSGEVEFWHFWGSPVRRNAIRRVVAICEQQLPNVSVTEVFKPFGDIWTANIAAVAGGSGMPDVIVADRPQLPRDAADGIYTSLQQYMDRDGFDPEGFWDFTWNQTQYEGQSYGVPFETDIRVLFYNQNLLEEAGIEAPRTWDDLWAAADELDVVGQDGRITRMAFFPLSGNFGPDAWAETLGHEWVQDGHPVVNDPKVVQTLEWILQWIERYGGWENVQRFLQGYSAPPNDVFMSNGVAMIVDIAGYNSILSFYRPRALLESGDTPNMEWGASLPPYAEQPSSSSGGFALSIPTGARNSDAAWEFIKCAASTPAQVSWSRDTYSIPTLEAAAREPELMADPLWEFFVEAMEAGQAHPYVPEYPNWKSELDNRYEQVWTGQLSPQQMVEEAQAAIDAMIEQNR